jgi:hypothetical protein
MVGQALEPCAHKNQLVVRRYHETSGSLNGMVSLIHGREESPNRRSLARRQVGTLTGVDVVSRFE